MPVVLQEWVQKAPWKMQSILLSGLRAPDAPTTAVKQICRWMRAEAQYNADPSKGYMHKYPWMQELHRMETGQASASQESGPVSRKNEVLAPLIDSAMDELEYLPCHYAHHFADALRVVAIFHPVECVRDFAEMVHTEVAVEIFHFKPETVREFIIRHVDKAVQADVIRATEERYK